MSPNNFSAFLSEYTADYNLSHWQIAENGVWEDSLQISRSPDEQEISAIEKYIRNAAADIAIEGFFKKTDDQFLFFGVRLEAYETDKKIEIVRNILTFTNNAKTDFDHFINFINTQGIFGKILDKKPDFLEIGAEGFWKSYGSLVVWKANNDAPFTIQDILHTAPQLLKTFKRSMMLELAYDQPDPHWLGLSLSIQAEDETFTFNNERYEHLTQSIIAV